MLAFVFELLDNLGRSDLNCSRGLVMYRRVEVVSQFYFMSDQFVSLHFRSVQPKL